MGVSIRKTIRSINPFSSGKAECLPEPLEINTSQKLVKVYVEGYEDVAFWRCIFDNFTNPYVRFEISVPNREDLPKGKSVLMAMTSRPREDVIMCVDSDFDYLFDGATEQSAKLLSCKNMFHTHTYATENYLCYAPSLHNVCVKATRNDTKIFDFEVFLSEYSKIIYPIFLWYSFSAMKGEIHMLPLADFRNAVKINYLEIEDNGLPTLNWLKRNVDRKVHGLKNRYPFYADEVRAFGEKIMKSGMTAENTYLFMHGHTLMDNVVMVLLETVCDKLRRMTINKISSSSKKGTALKNEMANYKNTLRPVRDVLLDNDNYTDCFLFKKLSEDIRSYIVKEVSGESRE